MRARVVSNSYTTCNLSLSINQVEVLKSCEVTTRDNLYAIAFTRASISSFYTKPSDSYKIRCWNNVTQNCSTLYIHIAILLQLSVMVR